MAESEEARKERLLKVSAKLFGENGYHHTRMAEIAKATRVSPKMLYKYYGSKKELFLSVREWAINHLLQSIVANLPQRQGDVGSWQIFEDIMRTYNRFVRKNKVYARILAEGAAEYADEDIMMGQQATFTGGVSILAAVITPDYESGKLKLAAEPDQVAWFFVSLTSLMAYAMLVEMDKKSAGLDPEFTLDFFLDLVSNPV